jgi:hypothetical protein
MFNHQNGYILTPNSLTYCPTEDGRSYAIRLEHPNWKAAKAALLAQDWDGLKAAMDIPAAISNLSEGNITVVNGVLKYKDLDIHNVVTERILQLVQLEAPFRPLMKFLDKLMANPSRRAVNELYTFLRHKNMPFTPDGNFLAYKSVKRDWTDHYSGKFDNKVGETLEMARNAVCDDADMGCSYGFHAGSLGYAQSFGGDYSHVTVVEIDPTDVVSVPKCSDCQKLRTAKYKVVGVFSHALEEPIVDTYFEGDYDPVTGEVAYN